VSASRISGQIAELIPGVVEELVVCDSRSLPLDQIDQSIDQTITHADLAGVDGG